MTNTVFGSKENYHFLMIAATASRTALATTSAHAWGGDPRKSGTAFKRYESEHSE
jgi:hypothetical protein